MTSNYSDNLSAKPRIGALMRAVFSIARCEIRGVLARFKLFIGLLAAGVFAIAAIGSFSKSLEAGLERDGKTLLGGDLAFVSNAQEVSEQELQFLLNRYESVSHRIVLPTIIHGNDDNFETITLTAVDDIYPLVPLQVVQDGNYRFDLLSKNDNGIYGILIANELSGALGVSTGDMLEIGRLKFEVRGILANIVELPVSRPPLAPPVMVSIDGVKEAGLTQRGSLYSNEYRVLVKPGTDTSVEEQSVRAAMPDATWRIANSKNGSRQIRFIISTVEDFFTLVGLVSLMVAGIGMVSSVNTYLDSRRQTVAILKSLGADSRVVVCVYLCIILWVSAVATAVGLVAATAIPNAVAMLLPDTGAIRLASGIYIQPMIYGAIYGFGVALAGGLWALSRVPGFHPQALFRDLISPADWGKRAPLLSASLIVLTALIYFTFNIFGTTEITSLVFIGMLICASALLVCAWLLRHSLKLLPPSRFPVMRVAVHNFCRPGTFVYSIFLSVGLSLTLLTTLGLVEGRISSELTSGAERKVPSFFVVGIQNDEIADFERMVTKFTDKGGYTYAPTMRGRVKAINGTTVEELKEQGMHHWSISGDRNFTFSAEPLPNVDLAEGQWWASDYSGPPQVSMEAEVLSELGMKLGDNITVTILGEDITATVTSSRNVVWQSFNINFAVVFDQNTLMKFPHAYLATLYIQPELHADFIREQKRLFPTITPIRVEAALEAIRELAGRVLFAVRMAGGFALLVGIMVLTGAAVADHRRRAHEATVYSVCGVSRWQVLSTYAIEYGITGAVLVSAVFVLSLLTVQATLDVIFGLPFSWSLLTHVGAPILGMIAVTVAGLVSTLVVLREKAATRLRHSASI